MSRPSFRSPGGLRSLDAIRRMGDEADDDGDLLLAEACARVLRGEPGALADLEELENDRADTAREDRLGW